MQSFHIILVLFAVVYSTCGKPFPSKEIETEDGPTSTTPVPWLRFLKNKKTTALPSTTETVPTTVLPPLAVLKGQKPPTDLVVDNIPRPASMTRALGAGTGPQPSVSEIDELIAQIASYFQPIEGQPNSVLTADRKANPSTFYDEMYLDWMKRDAEPVGQATPAPQLSDPVTSAPNPYGVAPPPPEQPTYMMPMPYSPFFPSLAGFKMQKAMAQAQMDAALTALLNITTTPKPIKLKLKIQVPGTTDFAQMGQLTAGISEALPPGSTISLD